MSNLKVEIKRNQLEYLCGYLKAREKFFLDETRIPILKSASSYEELLSLLSGTFYHHFMPHKLSDTGVLRDLEHGAGTVARDALKIGGSLVSISLSREITQDIKLSLLNRKIDDGLLLGSGFYAGEIRNPKGIAFFTDELTQMLLMTLLRAAVESRNLKELEFNLLVARRQFLEEASNNFSREMREFLQNIFFIEDIFVLMSYVSRHSDGSKFVCYLDNYAEFAVSPLRDLFSCGITKEEVFVRIFDIQPEHYLFKEFIRKIEKKENLEEEREVYEEWFDKIYENYAFSVITDVYPFYFFRKFYKQLRVVKGAVVGLLKSKDKAMEGEKSEYAVS